MNVVYYVPKINLSELQQTRPCQPVQTPTRLAEMLHFQGSRGRWPNKSISSVRHPTRCAEEGRWWGIIALPGCAGRPRAFITWWGHGSGAARWMISQSLFTFTMAVSPFLGTSPPPSPWQQGETTALLPFLRPSVLSELSAGSASPPSPSHDILMMATIAFCSFQLPHMSPAVNEKKRNEKDSQKSKDVQFT